MPASFNGEDYGSPPPRKRQTRRESGLTPFPGFEESSEVIQSLEGAIEPIVEPFPERNYTSFPSFEGFETTDLIDPGPYKRQRSTSNASNSSVVTVIHTPERPQPTVALTPERPQSTVALNQERPQPTVALTPRCPQPTAVYTPQRYQPRIGAHPNPLGINPVQTPPRRGRARSDCIRGGVNPLDVPITPEEQRVSNLARSINAAQRKAEQKRFREEQKARAEQRVREEQRFREERRLREEQRIRARQENELRGSSEQAPLRNFSSYGGIQLTRSTSEQTVSFTSDRHSERSNSLTVPEVDISPLSSREPRQLCPLGISYFGPERPKTLHSPPADRVYPAWDDLQANRPSPRVSSSSTFEPLREVAHRPATLQQRFPQPNFSVTAQQAVNQLFHQQAATTESRPVSSQGVLPSSRMLTLQQATTPTGILASPQQAAPPATSSSSGSSQGPIAETQVLFFRLPDYSQALLDQIVLQDFLGLRGEMNHQNYLESPQGGPGSNPRQAPSPSQGINHTNGMNGGMGLGGGMVGFPTPAGHQSDLNYVMQMVEDLSRVLEANKRLTEGIVDKIGKVRERAKNTNLSNDELIAVVASELNEDSENLERENSEMRKAIERSEYNKKENWKLCCHAANILANLVDQMHEFKEKHERDTLAWHKNYRQQLADEREENLNLRNQINDMKAAACRANEWLRKMRRRVAENDDVNSLTVENIALRQEKRFWKRMALPLVAEDDSEWSDDDDLADSVEKKREHVERVDKDRKTKDGNGDGQGHAS